MKLSSERVCSWAVKCGRAANSGFEGCSDRSREASPCFGISVRPSSLTEYAAPSTH